MKIYFAHSQAIDYKAIYKLLKQDEYLMQHTLILPHDEAVHENHTREFYKEIDLIIAEVSEPSIGLGIELGWAADDKTPVYCFYKSGAKPSSSIRAVTSYIDSYDDKTELIEKIKGVILDNTRN